MVPDAPLWIGYHGLDAKDAGHPDWPENALGGRGEQKAAASRQKPLRNRGPWQCTASTVREGAKPGECGYADVGIWIAMAGFHGCLWEGSWQLKWPPDEHKR